MAKFKSYEKFNEGFDMSSFFKSAHAAIEEDNLVPLSDVIGRPRFPTQEEYDTAVEYLGIDPDFLFYDSTSMISPILYWNGPVFYPFHGSLNMEALKMMRSKEAIDQVTKMMDKMTAEKKYESLFARMDKKILIPQFIKMYKEIPDNQKYDVFTDLYVRSEYGFGMFPKEIIEKCFSKRMLSTDWKKRMEELKDILKLNPDGTVIVYRGQNRESASGDEAFSWTLSKKTAKFFSERFEKGAGKIIMKKILPEEIIDYLDHRGESEIIVLPKTFKN